MELKTVILLYQIRKVLMTVFPSSLVKAISLVGNSSHMYNSHLLLTVTTPDHVGGHL